MGDAIRWLTIREAADRACCRATTIQRAVKNGHLRATRISARGGLRFLESWIDAWLIDQLMPEDREIGVAIDAAPSGLRELLWR